MESETTETPPLVLEDFIPYRLNKAAEAVSQRFASIYRDRYGLTRPEWRTLATLGQFGILTATAIGAHSSMHKTKVSRAVFTLEKRRWLSRKRDDIDRRIENWNSHPQGARPILIWPSWRMPLKPSCSRISENETSRS